MAELIKREGNKVEFRVTVPKTDVQNAYSQVWSAVSRDVRVPGFRPGKAPRSVLEKRVGTGYIEGEVRDRLLDRFYPQAVRELQLNLVDAEITPESLEEGADYSFTVKGETYPEVKLSDWNGVQLSASAPEITDEVLERTLRDLQERNATFESVERPAEATDMVTIEELGEEGGTYPIYLDVAEEHVREALLGHAIGEEVTIEVPAHDHGDHVHEAQSVKVRIVDIKHKKLQDLDDEFAKGLNFDSIERLRADLRGELERRAQAEGENARREEFVEKLVEGMTVEIPDALIERRQNAMLEEIKDDLGRQGVKWDEYEKFMQEQNKLDDFMTDLRKNAETRVRRDLALEQLAEDMKIGLTQQELDANLNALAQANRITVQQLRSQLGQNGLQGYAATIVRDKALATAVARLGAAETAKEEQPHAAALESSEPVTEPTESAEAADSSEGETKSE
ncbi:trigger factor [Deinococcus pimensis]|uniref:trigger factor n=1 Tax=Deinococcus pimensis TaxID=309888 RepID=UPI000483ED3A|nr:trigger factor [Deinococcus pimensis]